MLARRDFIRVTAADAAAKMGSRIFLAAPLSCSDNDVCGDKDKPGEKILLANTLY